MDYEIVPSLLPVEREAERYAKMLEGSVSRLHIDVMDGIFVEKKKFSPETVSRIKTKTNLLKEVHLMTVNPIDDIGDYALAGADIIIFHPEARGNTSQIINIIKDEEIKVGLAINPKTHVKRLWPYLQKIDQVLVMTVEPGDYGQEMDKSMLDKVRKIREKCKEMKKKIDIAVDGGVNLETIKSAKDAGANLFVCGNAIFGEDNIIESIKKLKEKIETK